MTALASEKPKRRRPWFILILGALSLAVVLLLVGGVLYTLFRVQSKLSAAIADADRSDPHWRLADLEASRETVPDEKNSAIQVRKVADLLPEYWYGHPSKGQVNQPAPPRPLDALWTLEPPVRLDEAQRDDLELELAPLTAAIAEARRLVDMPKGRHEVQYKKIYLEIRLSEDERARWVGRLIRMDVYDRAEDGDADGALESCQALLNVGRSIGDEPFVISQIVRIALDTMALSCLERCLAQGGPSDAGLARMLQALAEEERDPILLWGARGERAGIFDLTSKLRTGEVSLAELAGPSDGGPSVRPPPLWGLDVFQKYNQSLLLNFHNEQVALAGAPPEGRIARLKRYLTLIKPPNEFFQFHSGSLAYNLLNAFEAAAQADLRVRAHLRCAQAAIAAERYRMAHGTWPSGLDSLVFHGLPRIPIDPFDGKAIRMARTGDGLVLYSVGFDLEDDGGRLDPKPTSVSEGDLGFRLWEPARRRQAPVVENTLPSNVFAAEPP